MKVNYGWLIFHGRKPQHKRLQYIIVFFRIISTISDSSRRQEKLEEKLLVNTNTYKIGDSEQRPWGSWVVCDVMPTAVVKKSLSTLVADCHISGIITVQKDGLLLKV